MGAFQAVARERRVGRDHRVDAGGQRDLGHVGQFGVSQIGRDLEEDGDRARQPVTGRDHAGEQRRKRRLALKVAQLFGIGGGDIDGCEIDMRPGGGQHAGEIGGAVGGVLVGAKVQPHRHVMAGLRQPGGDDLRALVVEAEAVDDAAILGQTEKARRGVAGLRARGGGADLDKAETRAGQRRDRLGVLVEPGGKADRVGQVQSRKPGPQPGRGDGAGQGDETGPERADGPAMGLFRVKPVQREKTEPFDGGHNMPSGKIWPVAPRGSDLSQTTSPSVSAR